MALINSEYNLFTATSLPSKPLHKCIDDQIQQKDIPSKPSFLIQKNSDYLTNIFRNNNSIAKQISYQPSQTWVTFQEFKQLKFQNNQKAQRNAADKYIQQKMYTFQALINNLNQSNEKSDDKRNRHLEEIQSLQNYTKEYKDRILDMNTIQEYVSQQLGNFNINSKEIKNKKNPKQLQTIKNESHHNFVYSFPIILSSDWNTSSKIVLGPTIPNLKSIELFINPVIPYLVKNGKQQQKERIAFINFGKETYLNVRAVKQQTNIFYTSFFNQYRVEKQKNSMEVEGDIVDYNITYAHMIQEETRIEQPQEGDMEVQQNNSNLQNILLFPLDLYVWQNEDNQKTEKPYEQFGASSDILFLFSRIAVERIRNYKPNKVIVYMDGTTEVDPLHFHQIVRQLSDICGNNIMLYLKQDTLPYYAQNKMEEESDTSFFSKYMNFKLSKSESQNLVDNLLVFTNITSKNYIPVSTYKSNPSQKIRQIIRLDYIKYHLKMFPFMKNDLMKFQHSIRQIEDHTSMQYKILNIIKKQLQTQIPYRNVVLNLDCNSQRIPIHQNQKYSLSRIGVLYDIQKRFTKKEHKYILRMNKQTTQSQVIESIQKMRFFLKDSMSEVKLQEYSQVEIIQREKKLLVFVFNYFDGKSHKHLFGKTEVKSTSVFLQTLQPLNKEQQRDSINQLYVGYRFSDISDGSEIYLTWPLKIDIEQNFKAKIRGKIYKPQISDRILRIKVLQKKTQQKQKSDYLKLQKLEMIDNTKQTQPLFGARLFANIDQNSDPDNKSFLVVGGYYEKGKLFSLMNVTIKNNKGYSISNVDKLSGSKNFIPTFMDYNYQVKFLTVSRTKVTSFVFYDGRSPYSVVGKPVSIKYQVKPKSQIQKQPKEQSFNSKFSKVVCEPGYFNTLETYPINKVIKKYFNSTLRIRYTFRIQQQICTFDDQEASSNMQMIIWPIKGFDPSYPEYGTGILNENNRMKYLNFLYHNPLGKGQPFYMMIPPEGYQQQRMGNKSIKIKRIGNEVLTRIHHRRLGEQNVVDYRGNLVEVLQDSEMTDVRMEVTKISIKQSLNKPMQNLKISKD